MHLTEVTPHPCVLCGRGNVPRNDGLPNRFLDLERDVNWNDPVILCDDCCVRVGSAIGMLTPDDRRDLERINEKLAKEIHELKAQIDTHRRRASKAIRRARAAEAA